MLDCWQPAVDTTLITGVSLVLNQNISDYNPCLPKAGEYTSLWIYYLAKSTNMIDLWKPLE